MNAVIFDLDGTLWDATQALRIIWEKEIHRIGICRPVTIETMMGGMGLGPEALAEHMVPELPPEKRIPFFNHVTSIEPELIIEYGAHLYPGMVEVLHSLAKQYQIMIASNCVDGYIEGFLRYAHLENVVHDFAHPGLTGLSKAGNIRLLMDRNKIEKAIMIGDTVLDYEAACEAQIPFVFASYGFGCVEDAKWQIDTMFELPQMAAQLLE